VLTWAFQTYEIQNGNHCDNCTVKDYVPLEIPQYHSTMRHGFISFIFSLYILQRLNCGSRDGQITQGQNNRMYILGKFLAKLLRNFHPGRHSDAN
jgi:hypothetical protein